MRHVLLSTVSSVFAFLLMAAPAGADQVRVTVSNPPAGVPLAAILNAGNQSKPLTQTGRSNGSLTFAMIADAANLGKPVQVYLVEDDDDDRPAGIYFVLDGGAVPRGARLLGTITLTSTTSDVLIDYRTGSVTTRQTGAETGESRTLFGTGLQFGVHGQWVDFTNAGGGTICSTPPPGGTITSCDRDKDGGSVMFSALYGLTPWLSAGVAYETANKVTLNRVVTNNANPVTLTQNFTYDPQVFEMFGRVNVPVGPLQIGGIAGAAYVTAKSSNSFSASVGTNVVDTQTTNADYQSWSPLAGAVATLWFNRWFGVEGSYRWTRLKDGDVDEGMNMFSVGVNVNVGPHR